MADTNGQQPKPTNRWQAAGGLFCLFLVGILAVIDAMSESYVLELGPMALLLGTGGTLLGIEVVRKAADRIAGNGQ